MAIITKLVAQKKNPDRVNLYVDDEFFCGLMIDDVVKHGIVIGKEVSSEYLSDILGSSGENYMYAKTLAYILRSPRTEAEIRRYLSRKKDCSVEMTNRLIERLKTMNYINDEAYAKMFKTTKHVKISARQIKQKLRGKGVNDELIEEACADIDNQEELDNSIAEKYMRNKNFDQNNLSKLFRYLISKGFEYDVVSSIVEQYKKRIDTEAESFYSRQDEYEKAKERLKVAREKLKNARRRF